jgi:ribosomal protein L37AE/L43A
MDFDTASFLRSLFSGAALPAVPEVSAVDPQAAPIPAASNGPGAIDAGSGEAGGAAAVPQADAMQVIEPDEDAAPRPCPTCGGSDLWETIAGTWRCQHCDAAALARSRSLADKAARLRERKARA